MNIAILDDYQDVAAGFANWKTLGPDHKVSFFSDHIADPEALVERLLPFDIIMGMRERTPIPTSLLCQLHNQKRQITSRAINA